MDDLNAELFEPLVPSDEGGRLADDHGADVELSDQT